MRSDRRRPFQGTAAAGIVALASVAFIGCGRDTGPDSGHRAYREAKLPIERRVEDLLSRMTPAEKFRQLFMVPGDLETGRDIWQDGIFGLQVRGAPDARRTAEKISAIQRFFVEDTRLGIPIIPFEEALHGLVAPGATSFPQAIGLAATWDVDLVAEVAGAIADETRSRGVRQILSPVVNIARDVRWGRTEETYGEDPYLAARMAAAFVAAFEKRGVITTPKHFVANVGAGGRDSYPIPDSERELREVDFVPFLAALKEGGSRSIMTSYNSWDGRPCTANHRLLMGILKGDWAFRGFVISDANAVGGINDLHRVSASFLESGRQAWSSGLDVIFQTEIGHAELFEAAITQGLVPRERVDDAVRRVLRAKMELGLFEDPYVDPAEAERTNGAPAHRALARRAAAASVVLLKNEGHTLPLKPGPAGSIAVVGPDAVEARLGGYSGPGIKKISLLEAIRERAGAAGPRVRYAEGCGREVGSEASIADAVRLARRSGVTIVAAGIEEGEGRDRADIRLPGRQGELIRRIAATGTKTIVVLYGGSAVDMREWGKDADAILLAWYPGEEGGHGLVDVLWGDADPSGRLPVTFPLAVGQLPLVYNHKPTGRFDGYLDLPGDPLFPFGFGLSYTEFRYSGLSIAPAEISPDGRAKVSCTVTNTGQVAGAEVIQLYVHEALASVVRPVLELRGFRKVFLEPGASATVTFELGPAELSLVDADMNEVVETGEFQIFIGSSSRDIRLKGVLRVRRGRA